MSEVGGKKTMECSDYHIFQTSRKCSKKLMVGVGYNVMMWRLSSTYSTTAAAFTGIPTKIRSHVESHSCALQMVLTIKLRLGKKKDYDQILKKTDQFTQKEKDSVSRVSIETIETQFNQESEVYYRECKFLKLKYNNLKRAFKRKWADDKNTESYYPFGLYAALNTLYRDSNPDLPVIGSLVYHKSDALGLADTKAGWLHNRWYQSMYYWHGSPVPNSSGSKRSQGNAKHKPVVPCEVRRKWCVAGCEDRAVTTSCHKSLKGYLRRSCNNFQASVDEYYDILTKDLGRTNNGEHSNWKVCMTKKLVNMTFEYFHESLGIYGMAKTIAKIRETFLRKRMNCYIQGQVERLRCIRHIGRFLVVLIISRCIRLVPTRRAVVEPFLFGYVRHPGPGFTNGSKSAQYGPIRALLAFSVETSGCCTIVACFGLLFTLAFVVSRLDLHVDLLQADISQASRLQLVADYTLAQPQKVTSAIYVHETVSEIEQMEISTVSFEMDLSCHNRLKTAYSNSLKTETLDDLLRISLPADPSCFLAPCWLRVLSHDRLDHLNHSVSFTPHPKWVETLSNQQGSAESSVRRLTQFSAESCSAVVRYTMKYVHKDGSLTLKLTDDVVCLQYKTEILQDLKKVDKLVNNLMRHMASKEHKLVLKTKPFALLSTMLLLTTGRPLVAPKVFICDLRRSAITEFRLTSNALIVSLRRRINGYVPFRNHDYVMCMRRGDMENRYSQRNRNTDVIANMMSPSEYPSCRKYDHHRLVVSLEDVQGLYNSSHVGGQSTWSISLLSCSKKTIRTNKALNMKKANTDLLRSSMRSLAILSCNHRSLYLRRVSGLPLQDLHARIPDGYHDYLLRWCDVAMCDGHVDPVLYNIGTDSIRFGMNTEHDLEQSSEGELNGPLVIATVSTTSAIEET
uniref:SRP9 domain-containing protein n=1 Tax=Timema cristinae TaxID=61476 RepID=A0A7R9CKW5_TIMCR|nr:unnamed protein product [Timema cristinae]